MNARLPKRHHDVNTIEELPPRSSAGEAFHQVLLEIIQLSRVLTGIGENLARPAGQTLARWLVLSEVSESPATVAEIARSLRLARQNVQRVADLLVSDGLTTYADNPKHRRAKLLRITAKGRRALVKIERAQRAWTDDVGTKIGERKLRGALTLLDAIRGVVEDSASGS